MALPLLEPFTGSAVVLPDPPWTQQHTQTVNRDGAGLGKLSAYGGGIIGQAFDNSNTYDNDQYAQVKNDETFAPLRSGATYVGVMVRASGTGGSSKSYQFRTDGASGSGHTQLVLAWNDGETQLRSFATTFAANDVLRIEVSGTVITCYKNGSSLGTYDTVSDGNKIASGAAGVLVYNNGDETRLDTWEGGNIGASAVITGTATSGMTEADVVAGGRVITITLSGGATWIPA